MAKGTVDNINQAEEIQQQIDQALNEFEQIRNQRQSITTPGDLQAAEQVIITATDKLAALMTGLKIQQAVDSDDLKDKADQLVRSMPAKLKNQGRRRVVVSTDGGRIRIRKDKRGPRTKKGRRRYSTHWREPKLLMIYTVDEDGKMDRHFAPVIEGTLKGPDAVFGLLGYHLRQLNIRAADKLLFVADGARWIWNRVSGLIKSLGLSRSNVYELVDFYHAVEHLAKVADFKKNWTRSEKKVLDHQASAFIAQGVFGQGDRRD